VQLTVGRAEGPVRADEAARLPACAPGLPATGSLDADPSLRPFPRAGMPLDGRCVRALSLGALLFALLLRSAQVGRGGGVDGVADCLPDELDHASEPAHPTFGQLVAALSARGGSSLTPASSFVRQASSLARSRRGWRDGERASSSW
jgi:hypothetical protein